MAKLDKLFEPGKIGKMEIKNRVVMSGLGGNQCTDKGYMTSRAVDFWAERAKGGVGLIIAGICGIMAESPLSKYMPAIYDDTYIPGLRNLTSAIHEHGAKVALQLGYHGVQMSDPDRTFGFRPEDLAIVGPSPVRFVPTGVIPRELTKGDIDRIARGWAEAARRAKDAGFDAVEIHGCHGKLINQFFSPFFNKRTDEYGGSVEKRARFACEVIARTRERVGADFPIIIKINGEDGFEGGTTMEDTVRQAPLLVEAGVDALDIAANVGLTMSSTYTFLARPGVTVPVAAAVKKVVSVPVIATGRISEPAFAERILREGKVDFIGMARQLIADPEWPNKASEGRLSDIRRCILCENCHDIDPLQREKLAGRGFTCTVNPAIGREREFVLKPTASPKRVMVIGGGLAGMEAARTLAERGHQVSLYERSDKLGGQQIIALRPQTKGLYASLVRWSLSKGLRRAGVAVTLDKEVTLDFVKEMQPDVVVVATGATPVSLGVQKTEGKNIVQAYDVIAGKAVVGKSAVVIGGRDPGMETAHLLAKQGKRVSLALMPNVGRRIDWHINTALTQAIVNLGVCVYPCSEVIEVREKGVSIDSDKALLFLKADTIVLALGAKPDTKLAGELKDAGLKVYMIGDCVEARNAIESISEGAEIGRKI